MSSNGKTSTKSPLKMLSQIGASRTNGRNGHDGPVQRMRNGLNVSREKLRVETIETPDLPVRWINIERAEENEIAWLHRHFTFNPLHLEDVTSYVQRPKMDDFEDSDYLFLVLHFPVFNKNEKTSESAEIDLFIGPDYVVTVHDGELWPLNKLFEQCKNNPGKRHGMLNRTPAYLLYKILDVLVDYVFPILNKLAANLEAVDAKIFKASSQSTIYDISVVRRDILSVRRIMKPQISVISNLERRKKIVGDEDELEPLFADITDHINKIWDSLEEYKEVIESLSSTYEQLNSHRLNTVIKTLTIISVIMLPLTVITSLWGMNVNLPLMDTPFAFEIIIGLMIMTVVLMLIIFKLRKWL